MNRRTFLAGALAAPVVAALPESPPPMATGGYVEPNGRVVVGLRDHSLVPCADCGEWFDARLVREHRERCGKPRVYPVRGGTLTVSDGRSSYTVALGAEVSWRSAAGRSTMQAIVGRVGVDE